MRKIATLIVSTFAVLAFAGQIYAASPLTAQIEAPKSPTNQTDLNINVVALDQNQVPSITVQCYYQRNGGGFSTLGGPIAIIPGGNNTADCQTNSSIINDQVKYDFYAVVSDGTNSVTTQTVSTTFNTTGPDTPSYNGKDRVNVCDYKIKFHTANDGGKTVKVEVYRSENTSFTADSGSRVDTVSIGSNTDGASITTPPTCNKEYYFSIRAFDANGNGSGVVGDSSTVTTTTTTGTTGASSGVTGSAIPAGTAGNVLGKATGPTGLASGSTGAVLGVGTPSATPVNYVPPSPKPISKKTIAIAAGALLLLVIAWALRKKEKVV